LASAASNGNSESPKTSIDTPGPQTSTSKEEKHPSSPEDIRPLPKDGHRRNQNINKQKRTTLILTDYIDKYALKKKLQSYS
jgi:hypothetical protein